MVPGVFKQVNPCLMASPLLGLIWASNPVGSSKKIPVGINFLSRLASRTGSEILALRSIPDEPDVA
jgi:hypothetical protein